MKFRTDMTRREFLRWSARLYALAAIGSALPAEVARAEERDTADGVSWQKAPCRFCGTGCGSYIGVRNGRIVAVQGDRKNPVNMGLLCAKGYNAGVALYGKDRLTHPMIRKNGKLKKASWDEALDLVADNILKDPSKFSIYGSGQWTVVEGYAAMKFIKGGLSNNHIDPNARLCMASAVVGFIKTFGVDEPSGCYDDLDECDTVVCWGNNWAEMHPILYSRFIDRKQKGETVTMVDIGTRRTRTTEAADDYLEMKPQGDMAIANGICHLLVESGRYDKEFIDKHVAFKDDDGKPVSISQFRKFLQDYTPEKVEKLAGIPPAQLEKLADLFADRKRKIVSLWCMGVNQHTRGTAMNNLIYNVHFLAGKFGKPGSTAFSLTGQPSACGTCREVGTLAHALPGGRVVKKAEHRKQAEDFWNTRPGAINPKPGYHTVAMFKAFAKGDLKSMWVQVTNPAQTMPNLHENLANAQDRFLVVSDIYPTVTTELATVVLPSAGWVEKNGIVGNSERRTQQWFKMIEPPGDARDDVWQMIAVAKKLYDRGYAGMKDRDGNFLLRVLDEKGNEIPVWDWKTFKKHNVDRYFFEEYRPWTKMKHKDVAPYDVLAKERGMRWPVYQDAAGNYRETKRRFVEGDDPFVKKGSGLDFYMAKDSRAIAWARPYAAPPEVPDAEYPFWLCTGRVLEHWHSGTMTRRVPSLLAAQPSAYVELNPADASRLGISQGDKVKVTSRRGTMTLTALLDGRGTPQKGLVFVPFFDETKLINRVTLDAYCPMSKEPDYKKCAVKVERA
jgi:nitrate reductase NapA